MDIEKKILKIYEEIKQNKKSLTDLHEVALISPVDNTSVNSGFGARWGGSHNGVDLKADKADVKSPADGVVVKTAVDEYPCGGTIVIDHPGGFRTGFCHLQKINVTQGQQVKQGDVIGISGGGANDIGHGRSDGRHLHFTLRKNGELVNPMEYIDKDSVVMSGESPKSSQDSSTSNSSSTLTAPTTSSSTSSSTPARDEVVFNMAKNLGKTFLPTEGRQIQEQRSFGRDVQNRYGRVIIPKDSNPKIKSPISGVVDNSRYSSSCKNQITIKGQSNGKIYLQFCGIDTPLVRDGMKVSAGQVIGKTDTDVEASLFDSTWNRLYIKDDFRDKTPDVVDDDSKKKKKDEKERYYSDPAVALLASLPAMAAEKIFGNRYDKKTGEMTQKRWGGVADKREVDPWLLNLVKKPFQKKVNEDLERIKKLLK